tara:strand:- start:453 stop:641 length:189 start_codon:yes stop_codon:yes gene_type:complete
MQLTRHMKHPIIVGIIIHKAVFKAFTSGFKKRQEYQIKTRKQERKMLLARLSTFYQQYGLLT